MYASNLNQGGNGRNDFCDGFVAGDGRSRKAYAAD